MPHFTYAKYRKKKKKCPHTIDGRLKATDKRSIKKNSSNNLVKCTQVQLLCLNPKNVTSLLSGVTAVYSSVTFFIYLAMYCFSGLAVFQKFA